ncbi:MAG: phosphatidate cytidylyltransferase [Chitinophagales bacterium]
MNQTGGGNAIVRVATGLVLIPLALLLIFRGGRLVPLALGVITAGVLWEYHRLLKVGGEVPRLPVLIAAGVGVQALTSLGNAEAAAAVVFAALAVELGLSLLRFPATSLLRRAGALALGAVYVGYPLGLAERLWAASPWLVAGGFMLIWADDILAYFVGVNLGKHRLAPQVSPKKSLEGSLGGIAGAVIVALLIRNRLGLGIPQAAVTGLAVAVAGQAGDLVESALKRESGVKDSGRLLPGHGGLLDRFDSSLLAFPVLYVLLRMLQ